jgi:hypothetical protein
MPASISTDKIAADDVWLRDLLRTAFPIAHEHWGEWAYAIVQDGPHEKRSQLQQLIKAHANYSTASYALSDIFAGLLDVDGVPSSMDLAVAGCGSVEDVLGAVEDLRVEVFGDANDKIRGFISPTTTTSSHYQHARRLDCTVFHLEAIYMQRVIEDASLQRIEPVVVTYMQRMIDAGLHTLLPWKLLMHESQFYEIVTRCVYAFGLNDPDCTLATGYDDGISEPLNIEASRLAGGVPCAPRVVLQKFIAALGRDPDTICARQAPIDLMHFVGSLASHSAWFFNPWAASADASGRSEIREVAHIMGAPVRSRRPVPSPKVTRADVDALRSRGAGGGITDSDRHAAQVQKLTAPKTSAGGFNRPVRLQGLIEGARMRWASSHATVSAEQACRSPNPPYPLTS